MNYKSKIYDILNDEREDMIEALPQPTMLHRRPMTEPPSLKGGLRPQKHPDPGYFLPKDPATLATGSDVGSMRPSDQKLAMRRYIKANDLEDSDLIGGSHLEGGRGINWKKVGRSIKKGLSTVGKYATPVIKEVGKELLPIVKKEGLKALKTVAENPELLMAAAGRPKKNHRVIRGGYNSESDSDSEGSIHIDVNSHKNGGKRPNARAEIVKRVMREKGLSMIQASSYVKAHGLYKK